MLGANTTTGGWRQRLSAAVGLFFAPQRVHDATTRNSPSALRVKDDESTVNVSHDTVSRRVHGDEGSPGRGRPRRVHGSGEPDHGREAVVAPHAEAAENPWKPLIEMGVKDTVDEFVFYMLKGDPPYRLNHEEWLTQFRRWALHERVAPIPACIFLAAFGKHPAVRKGRDRLKQRDGKVIRLDTEARSPKRQVVYVLAMPRKLPGTVPVGDIVPKQTLPTKAERDRQKAAEAAQEQLPLVAGTWVAHSATAYEPMRRVA